MVILPWTSFDVVSGLIVAWETVWMGSNSSNLLACPQMLRVMPERMPYQIYSTEAALCDSLWWEDGAPSCSFSSLAGSLEIHSHYSWKRLRRHLAPLSGFPHAHSVSCAEMFWKDWELCSQWHCIKVLRFRKASAFCTAFLTEQSFCLAPWHQ